MVWGSCHDQGEPLAGHRHGGAERHSCDAAVEAVRGHRACGPRPSLSVGCAHDRTVARGHLRAADGHGDQALAEADLLLSFGPATWPHLLARSMLAEQLFRATSILANHPYHREG